ncbi:MULTISPECIES: Cd(II)/Pb(II)-responsive transcriptional regulator [Pseudomonadota]|uniref:Cd(II)/Pb(II)-responsive transcriptional regulator n=1 Tax=Comamonas nitrativorans TaxID=108437 RepID=A0ABV9GW35_9BURK|nr:MULTISPECIES: Cd(II)/Pb(II)-responsive transcriptional regulator [Pseudomonadota]KHE33011.1 MerR family transcriptional regulator [Pseudomonas aeruginosa]MDC3804539.1 Cd(II)/Pb(II)-responsive transcriptional regulator [Pseudomonas aeruginosa]MDP5707734.1 Cd(II)/Pb(II)-responsive transcriptional regulator [Pseudomonas aeruginosa]PRE74572.1 Cd(II)/Pb(II)-responsive transcriptional regulator [Burkholderia multivorans]WAJ80583.1 Cd(II)/Pb(II)-responsive transcriptional regulator [Pseudomonas ae
MKIGELALMAGCSVPTIRFYEAEGLLQAPSRTANNYRDYGDQHADRLAFVMRCRSLDMSHDEIRVLLQLQDDPERSCDDVNTLLDAHMRLVEQRIVELKALRKQLHAVRSTCAGGVCIGDCGALESLRSATGASTSK